MPAELDELLNDTPAQPVAPEATTESDVPVTETPAGTEPVTPTDATEPQSSPTTDTSSESADDLLSRALRVAPKAAQPTATEPAAAQALTLPPELQQMLSDPEGVKRLTNLKSLYDRQAAELGQHRQLAQSYQGLPPPDQLRAHMQRQQQEAEALKIKPWNPKHPDFQRTNSRLSNVRSFQGSRQEILSDPELTSDQKSRLIGNLAARNGITEDDVKLLKENEAYTQEVKAELERDPDAFVQSRVEQLIAQKFAQYEQFQQQRTQSQQFIEKNLPVIEKYQDVMLETMTHENRRDVALQMAQVMAERDSLLEKLKDNARVVETAKVQSHNTRARATVKRDAATVDAPSLATVMKADMTGLSNDQVLEKIMKARGLG